MKYQEAQRLLSRYLPILLFSITIIVTPWLSSDPINTPKFLLLTIAGAICYGLLIQNYRVLLGSSPESKVLLVLSGFFAFGLFASFLSSNLDWREQFFGVSGRNTGIISYLSLVSVLLAVVFFYSSNLFSRFLLMLVGSGLVSGAYGLLQLLSLDPINWQNPYNPVIGFLGNPNFQSSFLGISTVALFSYTISSGSRLNLRVLSGMGILLNSVVIYKSDSQQGALVLILGISLVTLGYLYALRAKIYFQLFSVLFSLGIFTGIMGILEKGPLASILYKPSVTFRGDYWRAGFKMFNENILTGLGIDSYGSYYRQYRDLAAVTRRGPEITSNAAHNVVIDLAANGGLLLVIPYLLLIVFTFWIFMRAIRVQSDNKSLILVFALWVCYQAQSIISINQLALAAWGWVLMGLTIALSLNTLNKTEPSSENKKLGKSKLPQNQTSASTVLLVFLSLIIGISIGALPLNASANQKNAITSGKTDSVIAAAYSNPLDPNRMNVLAAILANYSYPDEALKLSKKTVEIFPLSYDAWRIISQLDTASSSDKAKALQEMRRLDPLNETIGK
jgi:O-antigen ligase